MEIFMDKILVKELPPQKANGKGNSRKHCIVQCPDCSDERIVRYDAYKKAATTCCSPCTRKRNGLKQRKAAEDMFNQTEYYRSRKGKASRMYSAQVNRSKSKGWPEPSYSIEEFVEWCLNQPEYHTLYDSWVASNYSKNLSPSTDRIDDYISYRLDNIKLVSWGQNNSRGTRDQLSGVNTKNSIAVDQLTMSGDFIARFHSCISAERHVNASSGKVSRVCKGKAKHAAGYKWRYSHTPNDNTMQD